MKSKISLNFIIIIFLSIFCFSEVIAQKNGVNIRRADRFYNTFDFPSALPLYKAAVSKNPDNLYIKGRIGNCYKFLNRIHEAEEWYESLANSVGVDPVFKFYYAQSLMANGKYEQALDEMNRYYKEMGLNDRIVKSFPQEIFDLDERFTIEIEDFNTKHADFSPYKIVDDLFFISNRKDDVFYRRNDVWSGRPFTQIFRMKIETDEETEEVSYKSPEIFGKGDVSSRYHEGPLSFDRKQADMYITRTNYTGKKDISKGSDNEVNLKILKLVYDPSIEDFGTNLVDNFSFSSNQYSIAYPAVTADGQYIFFASDMPGGYGGLDLYVAENIGGLWSNPLNLGDKINTPGNETFPFILPSGKLFFSSDGLLGLGGLDLFYADLQDDGTFSEPVNMGAPINSNFDDFGFYTDDKFTEGYFTSNRPSAYGDDDIYSFTKKGFVFEAIVFDSKSEERLDSAKVVFTDLDTKKELVLYTDANGYVTTPISPNTNYNIKISKETYLSEEAEFISSTEDIYAEIPLVKDFGIVLDVTVQDIDTKEELASADVVLIDLRNEREYSAKTNAYGKVSFVLDPGREYRIKASKELPSEDEKYLVVSKDFNTFSVKPPANLFTVIELKKEKLGIDIKIENIYYDLDKYYIRDDAAIELDKLVKIMLDNPTMEIELSSHTDCRGTSKYNMWLSAKRAESAVNYLIDNGVSYRRLTAAGYGESRLVNDCACEGTTGKGLKCSEDQHQSNRRTVFTILKF